MRGIFEYWIYSATESDSYILESTVLLNLFVVASLPGTTSYYNGMTIHPGLNLTTPVQVNRTKNSTGDSTGCITNLTKGTTMINFPDTMKTIL